MAENRRHVLLIEDSPSDAVLYEEMLRDAVTTRFSVAVVPTLAQAMDYLNNGGSSPDVVLADLQLPDSAGLGTLTAVCRCRPDLPVVVLTQVDDGEVAVEAVREGAQDWLTKGLVAGSTLERTLNYAIERNRMARQLAVSEQKFRQLAENINDVFWLSDAETGDLVYVSPAYVKIWNRPDENLGRVAQDWLLAVHTEEPAGVRDRIRDNWKTGQFHLNYRITRPDGSVRYIYDRATPILDAQGKVYRVAGIAEDVTDRKQLERELAEVTAKEQQRIGGELHDNLGQQLTGIGLLARGLQRKLNVGGSAEAATAGDLADNVAVAQQQLRTLIKGLIPVEVDSSGLMAALAQLAEQTERMCAVDCTLDCAQPVEVDGAATATNLYRIAQESINNAVRHAKARKIMIRLTSGHETLIMEIRDNGIGLSSERDEAEGMGLRIMRYRAEIVGAALNIRAAEGGGTIVTCRLNQKVS
ncbi:MAG: response regulator [Planctomycetota bacterium]|nr:response regulator [Planctomycetota bacterium]